MYFRNSATSSMARSREVLMNRSASAMAPLTTGGRRHFLQALEVAIVVDKLALTVRCVADVGGDVRIVVVVLIGRRRADVPVQVRGVRVVDYPLVDRVRALGVRDLRVRVDAEVEGIELPHAVADLAFHHLQEAIYRVGFLAARDLDHAAVLDIDADRFLPGRGR